MTLEQWLRDAMRASGAIDFSVRVTEETAQLGITIHPTGVDGPTGDFILVGNRAQPDRRLQESP